jgi:hypothetical protein
VAIVSDFIVACNEVVASGLRECSSYSFCPEYQYGSMLFKVSARRACILPVIPDVPPVIQYAADIGSSVSEPGLRRLVC